MMRLDVLLPRIVIVVEFIFCIGEAEDGVILQVTKDDRCGDSLCY